MTPRVQLSPNGPSFSQLVYGTWRILDDKATATPEHLMQRFQKCLDLGITTLDTAEIYGVYRVEEFIGQTLQLDPSIRSKLEIVTKSGIYIPCEFHPDRKTAFYNATAERIVKSAEKSLRFLGTDYIDLLLVHRPDWLTSIDETAAGLNKLLKDFACRSRFALGYDVDFIPGWDCHGLPIENAIEKLHGRSLPRDVVQAKSRAFATEQIAQQMLDFQRLGVLGDWAHPYRTMDPGNEAGEMRVLKRLMERGFVYRGSKPVYWCFDCGSSLAEFEIEYADKTSQSLDVAFLCAEPDRLAAAFGLPSLSKDAFAVIWTTTAWTIPANQALNLNPALDYSLVDTERGLLLLASARVEDSLKRYGLEGQVVATTLGEKLDGTSMQPKGGNNQKPKQGGLAQAKKK